MPSSCSRALAALAAMVGLVPECSGTMIVVWAEYSGAGCAAAQLNKHVFFKVPGKCEVMGGNSAVYSCSGNVLSMAAYNDPNCNTLLGRATYQGADACVPHGGIFVNGHCVDSATLTTWSQFGAEDCAASSRNFISYSPACTVDRGSSFGTVLSSDGTHIIRNSYPSTQDCTGSTTATGLSGTYECGKCLNPSVGLWQKFTCPVGVTESTSTGAAIHFDIMLLSVLAAIGMATM